jgi:hypothetical protein
VLASQHIPVGIFDKLELEHDCDCGKEHAAEAYGMFDPDIPAIAIAQGQGAERVRETLCHEIVHAMLRSGGLNNLFSVEGADEEFTGRFAGILLDLLRSNGKIIAWLQVVDP